MAGRRKKWTFPALSVNGSSGPFAIMIIQSKQMVYINATSTRECAFRAVFAAECW
jgi:hypothetical protein